MTATARLAALALSATALVALGMQLVVILRLPAGATLPAALWTMAGYFTILTNALVAGHFAAVAAGWRIPGTRAAALVLWIGMVGLVYHAVLAGLWAPQGLAWWADQGLHSATPILTLLWWLAFAPPHRPGLADVARWLAWPLAYCAYALARGVATGFWPYPFLDPGPNGAGGVAVNILGLIAAFAALGAVIAAVARLRFSR